MERAKATSEARQRVLETADWLFYRQGVRAVDIDRIIAEAGAEPYKRDLKTIEYHLLDAGHFALETNGDEIARLMRAFLAKHVK